MLRLDRGILKIGGGGSKGITRSSRIMTEKEENDRERKMPGDNGKERKMSGNDGERKKPLKAVKETSRITEI